MPDPGYCISQHLDNHYGFCLSPEMCFIWCAPLSVDLCRSGSLVHGSEWVDSSNDTYLSGTNTLAVESFASHGHFVLRHYHTNKMDEIEWMAQQSKEGIKFLVGLNSPLYEQNDPSIQVTPQVLGIAHFDAEELESSHFSPYESPITLGLSRAVTIKLTGNDFNRYWILSGNENFNAHRYMLIPPSFRKDSRYFAEVTRLALFKQVRVMSSKVSIRGVELLKRLRSSLKESGNTFPHKQLILNTAGKSNGYFSLDMYRLQFASSLAALRDQGILKARDILIENYRNAGEYWRNLFLEASAVSDISVSGMIELYDSVIHAELVALDSLKKCLQSEDH